LKNDPAATRIELTKKKKKDRSGCNEDRQRVSSNARRVKTDPAATRIEQCEIGTAVTSATRRINTQESARLQRVPREEGSGCDEDQTRRKARQQRGLTHKKRPHGCSECGQQSNQQVNQSTGVRE